MSTAEQAPPSSASKESSSREQEDANDLQIFIDNFKQNIIPKWRLDREDKTSPLVNQEMQARIVAGLNEVLHAYRVADTLPDESGDKLQNYSGARIFEYILNSSQMKRWPVDAERKWQCARQLAGSVILYACELCPEGSRFAIDTDAIPKGPPPQGKGI